MSGSVKKIWISPSTGQPVESVTRVEAVAHKGLVGDRYYLGKGYYTGDKVWDAHVTLIAQEAHDAASADGDVFSTDCLRRNIVTKGIDLSELIGARFKIGTAEFEGTKLWPPCKFIDSLNPGRDVLRKFAHSAGIGANVLVSGVLSVDDLIELC